MKPLFYQYFPRNSTKILFSWVMAGFAILSFSINFVESQTEVSTPVNLLFDTDIGPDCDDAGAMAILHAMADLGEVQLLGMAFGKFVPAAVYKLTVVVTINGRPRRIGTTVIYNPECRYPNWPR